MTLCGLLFKVFFYPWYLILIVCRSEKETTPVKKVQRKRKPVSPPVSQAAAGSRSTRARTRAAPKSFIDLLYFAVISNLDPSLNMYLVSSWDWYYIIWQNHKLILFFTFIQFLDVCKLIVFNWPSLFLQTLSLFFLKWLDAANFFKWNSAMHWW